ncbi:hypothetical protein H9K76_21805 [Diaphorobacter ruginosibacter]|uniref:Uncharacterized protein n=1 Tax=Diaphorobacter ruginosibacter TaxID=1715720 RepID=A0A7G9RNA8_9BURK|nr:hypothetical protein [Diaphorobacter ruginosibacter]QNN57083.1 hypothetical protein H9K76_21805 [Diaphorobacter ruginosibacter]
MPWTTIRVVAAVLALCGLAACTSTTPHRDAGSMAGQPTGVTVFGTVDMGVGGVK